MENTTPQSPIKARTFLQMDDPTRAIRAIIKLFLGNDWSGHTDAEIRRDAEVLREAARAADMLGKADLKKAASDAWWQVVCP